MGFEDMSFVRSEAPEPQEPKKEKSGASKFLNKLKTGLALTATAFALSGNLDAQGADTGPVNDNTRNEHFYAFTERYTEAVRLMKKAKTPEDAKKAAAHVDSIVQSLADSKRQTTGDNAALDRRFVKSLDDIRKVSQELQQKFGLGFEPPREAALAAVEAPFLLRLNPGSHPAKTNKNDGWTKTSSGPVQIGVGSSRTGARVTGSPLQSAPKSSPKKR